MSLLYSSFDTLVITVRSSITEEVANQLLKVGVSVGDMSISPGQERCSDRGHLRCAEGWGRLCARRLQGSPQRKQLMVAQSEAKAVIVLDSSETLATELFPDQRALVLTSSRGTISRASWFFFP